MHKFSTGIVFFLIAIAQHCRGCPDECACITTAYSLTVNCSYRQLTSFPSLLGVDTLTMSDSEQPGANQDIIQRAHLLVNGNQIKHVLRSKLEPLATRLRTLEIDKNDDAMDVSPKLLADLAKSGHLEILRLGPLRGDLCSILNHTYSLPKLRELSIAGPSSCLRNRGSPFFEHGVDCVLNVSALSTKLRALRLINCGSISVDGESRHSLALEELRLIGMRITRVPQLATKLITSSLKSLDLSQNFIKSLWGGTDIASKKFSPSMCILKSLNLSYNELSSLGDGTLEKCAFLEFLDVSHNPLVNFVRSGLFLAVSSLTLDLSYTKVNSLQAIAFDRISSIRAFQTKLQCDCDNLAQGILELHGCGGTAEGVCQYHDFEATDKTEDMSFGTLLYHCFGDSNGTSHNTLRGVKKTRGKTGILSPWACCVCTAGCVIHGLLVFAVVFAFKNRTWPIII